MGWWITGWCSTLTLLLICSSISIENCHPLLIWSSLSIAQRRASLRNHSKRLKNRNLVWVYWHLSHEKNPLPFHYTGCLIRVLNISYITGWYNPLNTLNNQGPFFHCSCVMNKLPCSKISPTDPWKMGPRKFHQQFMFRMFCREVWVKGEVWGPIFPGAHVGKIIANWLVLNHQPIAHLLVI